MRQKKGFPIWGKLSAKRTDEGKAYVAAIKTGNKANFPLIRRCGATFSLRAKSRLRRLRSDTRLRAQPLGGSCQRPRPLTDEGEACLCCPFMVCRPETCPSSGPAGPPSPKGEGRGAFPPVPPVLRKLQFCVARCEKLCYNTRIGAVYTYMPVYFCRHPQHKCITIRQPA